MGEYLADSQTTNALLERAGSGDRQAFEELMSRHVDGLRGGA